MLAKRKQKAEEETKPAAAKRSEKEEVLVVKMVRAGREDKEGQEKEYAALVFLSC